MVQRLRDHASVQGVTSFSEDLTSADWKTKIYFSSPKMPELIMNRIVQF